MLRMSRRRFLSYAGALAVASTGAAVYLLDGGPTKRTNGYGAGPYGLGAAAYGRGSGS